MQRMFKKVGDAVNLVGMVATATYIMQRKITPSESGKFFVEWFPKFHCLFYKLNESNTENIEYAIEGLFAYPDLKNPATKKDYSALIVKSGSTEEEKMDKWAETLRVVKADESTAAAPSSQPMRPF